MIIFDLDGTLADCEHRRHFITRPEDVCYKCFDYLMNPDSVKNPLHTCSCGRKPGIWKCNWKSFFDACDQDKPIYSTIFIFNTIKSQSQNEGREIQIWSGRCESVKKKTERWLYKYTEYCSWMDLKMRPVGDTTPDEVLKERWLDEAIAQGKTIDFVFDDRHKVVQMWRSRGIFVFDCNQTEKEF